MLELFGTFFSSIISGGLTGILGVAVQRFADYKNKELDLKLNQMKLDQEVELKKADAAIMAQEWAAKTQVAQIEASGAESISANQAFASSFNEPVRYSDKVTPNIGQSWVLIFLDLIRGIVRPGLTIYLCVLTSLIYLQSKEALGGNLSPEQSLSILKMTIGTILYLTTTCLLWWFGVRNKQPAPKIDKGV